MTEKIALTRLNKQIQLLKEVTCLTLINNNPPINKVKNGFLIHLEIGADAQFSIIEEKQDLAKTSNILLDIFFYVDYPFRPPLLQFKTKIRSENIEINGKVCTCKFALIGEQWKTFVTLNTILFQLKQLLFGLNKEREKSQVDCQHLSFILENQAMNLLENAGVNNISARILKNQLRDYQCNPIKYCYLEQPVITQQGNLKSLKLKIIGPLNTPFSEGRFTVQLEFKQPTGTPHIIIKNQIFHPNITNNGFLKCCAHKNLRRQLLTERRRRRQYQEQRIIKIIAEFIVHLLETPYISDTCHICQLVGNEAAQVFKEDEQKWFLEAQRITSLQWNK